MTLYISIESPELTKNSVNVYQFECFRGGLIPYKKDEPLTQKTEADILKSDNIEDYKGLNEAYYKVLHHYINLYNTKYGKDIKKMITREFPPVGDGPLIAAFHGIIQLGYGYAAGSDSVMLRSH